VEKRGVGLEKKEAEWRATADEKAYSRKKKKGRKREMMWELTVHRGSFSIRIVTQRQNAPRVTVHPHNPGSREPTHEIRRNPHRLPLRKSRFGRKSITRDAL